MLAPPPRPLPQGEGEKNNSLPQEEGEKNNSLPPPWGRVRARPGLDPGVGGIRRLFCVCVFLPFLTVCSGGDERAITKLAAQKSAAGGDELSLAAIPPTDLPPDGTRSLFDHLIKEHGSLPYPFEKLVELLAQQDEQGLAPVTVLIPDGRSLLKAYADFQSPRIVVAGNAKPAYSDHDFGPVYRGRLFLGFVENASEIEVISYNEAAGRFEFQLVKNYCEGCVPRLVYAKRAICTTCHVGAGPIFPTRPWEETNGQPGIAQHIVATRKAAAGDRYHGVTLAQPLAMPEAFDDLTDVGNAIPTTQRIWIDGCGGNQVDIPPPSAVGAGGNPPPPRPSPTKGGGEIIPPPLGGGGEGEGGGGTECRRLMLKLALRYLMSPALFDAQGQDAARLRALQAKHWPAGGIAQNNGDLFNRNPLKDPGVEQTFWDRIKGLFRSDDYVKTSETPNSEAGLQEFEKLPRLRPEFDPLSPRVPKKTITAQDLDGVTGLALLFGPNDRKLLEKHSGYNQEWLEKALESGPNLAALLKPQPLSRSAVLAALLKDMQAQVKPEASWISVEGMSPPSVDGAPPLKISAGSVLKHYETYCFGCHRGNPNARLDFMNGASEEEVLEHIKDKQEIAEALDYERYLGTDKENKLMPPADSYQRRLLDEARAVGKDDTQKMAEIIPGLFEF